MVPEPSGGLRECVSVCGIITTRTEYASCLSCLASDCPRLAGHPREALRTRTRQFPIPSIDANNYVFCTDANHALLQRPRTVWGASTDGMPVSANLHRRWGPAEVSTSLDRVPSHAVLGARLGGKVASRRNSGTETSSAS
jgi:hypothetical protein